MDRSYTQYEVEVGPEVAESVVFIDLPKIESTGDTEMEAESDTELES